jgi:UDP-N-acetylglucosamine transferase subunit ALG13
VSFTRGPNATEQSLILLSLGTHQQSFDRALDLVEPLALQGMPITVQHGSTPPRPAIPNFTWLEYMPFEDMVEAMAKAQSVICHAGVGTIMTAMQAGHTPVVIPRQARYGEHVDDHQVDIATRFASRELVRCVTTELDLKPLLTPRSEDSKQRIGQGSKQFRAAVSEAVAGVPRHRPFRLRYRRSSTADLDRKS